jgi:hypothetical protein
MDLIQKLAQIQHDLKVPKSNFNSHGKYRYRSIEDIQEAVKPHLKKHECFLTFSDEISEVSNAMAIPIEIIEQERKTKTKVCQIGSMVIVQSIAKLTDKSGNIISTTAFAAVDHIKGMNMAQAFGAASSYARKYAAGGLFLLDDTKESDQTNDHGKKEDDHFETMLKWITTYPTQVNYDKIATGYSNAFTDDQFKKFQAVVDLAQGLSK